MREYFEEAVEIITDEEIPPPRRIRSGAVLAAFVDLSALEDLFKLPTTGKDKPRDPLPAIIET